ncbi:MAG: hypothetical protein EOL87_10420 [Spartobacteria bacterium]|nr:hypothetical protein [Spartobacteria bacterium]
MNTKRLMETAGALNTLPAHTTTEYAEQRDAMAAKMNDIMRKRPDLMQLIGADNLSMMEDNHRNHARFMESLFKNYSAEVFVHTVLWVFRTYRAHGFSLAYWPAQLDTWIEVMKESLTPEAFQSIYPFYDWMLVNQSAFTELSDEMLAVDRAPSHGV